MKKIFTLIAAACLCVCASAKTRNAEWGTPAGHGTWDAATSTYSWDLNYSNLTTIFDCNADKLSNYTSLHLTTSDYVTDGQYRVCFMTGSTATATITFYSAGQKDLVFADRTETKDLDLSTITHISFGGASSSGSIKVTNVYLEGPDGVTLLPQNLTEISSLTGTNTNWASKIKFPMQFAASGESWGDGDGSNQATHVTITDYKKITFHVSSATSAGCGLRVWIWNGSSVTTLYAYPEAEYETATFTEAYKITTPGYYSVNVEAYDYLKGVKAANDWGNNVVVDYAWIQDNHDAVSAVAVEGARTLSAAGNLDFTKVTDVEAYIATAVNGETLQMKKVSGVVPANTGLVLKQTSDKVAITIPVAGTATEDVSGNLLVATTAPTQVPAGSYVLAGKGEDLGWYSVGASVPTLAAGKCYLTVPAAAAGSHFVMDFDSEEGLANSIEKVETTANGIFYTLQGAKVEAPQKGNIYVVNGKKVIY